MAEVAGTEVMAGGPQAVMTASSETPLPEPLRRILRRAGSEYETDASFALTLAERQHLETAIELAQGALLPAGPDTINRAVAFLSALPAPAMATADGKMALQLYRVGLKDIPRDLLALACETAAQTCRWRPSPAELRALVAGQLTERRTALRRLEKARHRASQAAPTTFELFDTKAILDKHWPDRDKFRAGAGAVQA